MTRLLYLLLCVLPQLASAQNLRFDIEYDRPNTMFGMRSTDIDQLSDGGFMILTSTGNYSYDSAVIIRTDSIGNILWEKGFKSQYFNPNALIPSGTSSYFLISYDVVVKIDTAGNILWSKQYSQPIAYAAPTNNGGLICENGYTAMLDDDRLAIFKLDSSGNVLWSTVIDSLVNNGARGITAMSLANGTEQYIAIGKCYMEYNQWNVASCISENGVLQWNRLIDPNMNFEDIATGTDSSAYISGYLTSPSSSIFLIKMLSDGSISFVKSYGVFGFTSIRAGNFIHIHCGGGALLPSLAIDTAGNVLWAMNYTYAGSDISASAHVLTSDGAVALLTMSSVNFNPSTGLLHLLKTDAIGIPGCTYQNLPLTIQDVLYTSSSDYHQVNLNVTWTNHIVLTFPIEVNMSVNCGSIAVPEFIFDPNAFSIVPTPACESFSLQLLSENAHQVDIINTLGQTVWSVNDYRNGELIDCRAWPSGSYFILVNGAAIKAPLLIQH